MNAVDRIKVGLSTLAPLCPARGSLLVASVPQTGGQSRGGASGRRPGGCRLRRAGDQTIPFSHSQAAQAQTRAGPERPSTGATKRTCADRQLWVGTGQAVDSITPFAPLFPRFDTTRHGFRLSPAPPSLVQQATLSHVYGRQMDMRSIMREERVMQDKTRTRQDDYKDIGTRNGRCLLRMR